MKKLPILLTIVIVALMSFSFLSACAPPAAEKPVVLREACSHPASDDMAVAAIKMAERINSRIGGAYVLQIHPGDTISTTPESLDAVRTGTVELAQWPVGVFAHRDPAFASAELPFLYNNVEANAAACKPLLPLYSAALEKKFNQKALSLWTATSLDLCSQKRVRTMEDWKGLLVHAINPATAAVAETLGGSAVSMPWPEAYTALDKGVVDAGMYATQQMVLYRLDEVARYVVPVYMVPTFMITTINLDVWNKLPKNVQDIILDEQWKKAEELNAHYIQRAIENPKILAERGMDIHWLPDAERDRWRNALKPYVDSQLAQMDPDFRQKLMAIVNQVNTQYPYKEYKK